MRRAIRIAGYGLMTLLLGGVLVVAILAASAGEPWLWRNYWRASVGTWMVLVTFAIAGVIGVIWLGQRIWRWWRARR